MDFGILAIIGILLVVLFLVRKLGGLLKLLLLVVLAAVLLVAYVLVFPTSPVSKQVTSWVAQSLTIDPKDEHLDGEVIMEFNTQSLAEGVTSGLDGIASALSGNPQLDDFFSKRLAAFIESQAKAISNSDTKLYRLNFKDSYLQIDCSDVFTVITIIKEKQDAKAPA